MRSLSCRRSLGFTLIELMITVAIVAILARIAYASYAESVNRAKRAQAQTAIISLAQALERYYTKCNSYNSTTSPCATTVAAGNAPASTLFPANVPSSGTAYYTLSLNIPSANTYTITATRIPTGSMKNDKCGNFTFTSAGSKGLTNNTKAVTDCWK